MASKYPNIFISEYYNISTYRSLCRIYFADSLLFRQTASLKNWLIPCIKVCQFDEINILIGTLSNFFYEYLHAQPCNLISLQRHF